MTVDIPEKSAAPTPSMPVQGGQAPVMRSFPTMRVSYAAGIDAIQAPQLPKDYGRGYFTGLNALAQGLEGVSRFMQGLTEQRAKALSLQQVNDGEVAMTKAHGDFQAWMEQNKDKPDTWNAEWEKRSADLKKSLFDDNENLSDFARDHLNASFGRFNVGVSVGSQVASVKQQFANTRDSGIANAMAMAQAGDYEGASAKVDALASDKFLHDTDAFRLKQTFRDKHEADLMDSFKAAVAGATPDNGGYIAGRAILDRAKGVLKDDKISLMKTSLETKERSDTLLADIGRDPVAALKQLEERNDNGDPVNETWLPPAERSQMLSHARAAAMQVSNKEQDEFLVALAHNAIPDEASARKFFSPATPGHLVESLVSRWRDGLPDSKEAFMDTQSKILGFDKNDPEAKFNEAALRSTIKAQFQPEASRVLNEMLDQRLKQEKPEHNVKKFVNDAISDLHKEQLLGIRYKDQSDAIEAVHDPKVLEAFGIKPETGWWIFGGKDAVLKTDGPASLDIFRKEVAALSKKGKNPIVTDKYNALPPETQAIVQKILRGSAGQTEDTNLRIQSASNATALLDEFDNLLRIKPDTTLDEAKKWLDTVQSRYAAQSGRALLREGSATSVKPMTAEELRLILNKYKQGNAN